MSSPRDEDSPTFSTLPPVICANLHEKILAEEIPPNEIVKLQNDQSRDVNTLEPCVPLEEPIPLHPLAITWSPDTMFFEIEDKPVVQRLWVWNSSSRSIYVHCCDIWDDTAYLGARWCCYPQTRFLLAPGLMAEMFVRASPKDIAPMPCADAKLQLAAAHMRDHVTGFFAVPINVRFLNHVPYVGEGG